MVSKSFFIHQHSKRLPQIQLPKCQLRITLVRRLSKGQQLSWAWGYTPLSAALGRQRQDDLSNFRVSLVYTVRSRTAGGYIVSKKGGDSEGLGARTIVQWVTILIAVSLRT